MSTENRNTKPCTYSPLQPLQRLHNTEQEYTLRMMANQNG